MELSYELISQFAKQIAKEDKKTNTESTVYGTIMVDGNNKKYVKLDGSDQLTPLTDTEQPSVTSSSANANEGERVSVLIKNHTATVTGNISSPAARTGDVENVEKDVDDIKKFDIIITEQLQAQEGYIQKLQTDKANVGDLTAATAKITELEAKDVEITGLLEANKAEIDDLKVTKIDAEVANVKFATVEKLDATIAEVDSLKAKDIETDKLIAGKADIDDLNATNAEIENLGTKYANIDFANIGEAAIKKLFTDSGIIKDLVVSEGHITGELVGVTIKGDLIEGGTVIADALVILGEDGLYYKLNYDGGALSGDEVAKTIYYVVVQDPETGVYTVTSDTLESPDGELIDGAYTTDDRQVYRLDDGTLYCEVVEYPEWAKNSLHGSVITAKSVTAEKVRVDDLVAFEATIGGFHIASTTDAAPAAIYSGAKGSVDADATPGIYLDSEGQMSVGNEKNFIKFYKDDEGNYKLVISAESILLSTNKTVEDSISEAVAGMQEAIDASNSNLEENNKGLQNQITDIKKRFTFDENGITVGNEQSTNKVVIDDDEVSVMVNDEPVQQFLSTGDALIPKAKITKSAYLLGYLIEEDENGIVSCTYVEE